MTKKRQQIEQINEKHELYRFNGALFHKEKTSTVYNRVEPDDFQRLCYSTLGPATKESEIRDLAGYFYSSSPDLTKTHSHLIGLSDWRVWDTTQLKFVEPNIAPIYQARTTPSDHPDDHPTLQAVDNFILELANGDPGVRQDIYQSLAPFFMDKKPPGVIWFYGNGANGKSSLIEAVTRIIGDHLVSISLEGIESGRNAPQLNGSLGNLVRESSEAYVENSSNYKSLGTHEPFMVDKMYSQAPIRVGGNIHSVFNANNLPTFADKSRGISRRTFTVPFNNIFEVDLTFEDRTFTPEFLSALLQRILEYTHFLRDNNYQYQWSNASVQLKATYDQDQDSAKAYLEYIRSEHPELVGFRSYGRLGVEYENWCIRTGSTKLSANNLKKTFRNLGEVGERRVRLDGKPTRVYMFESEPSAGVEMIDGLLIRPGEYAKLDQVPLEGL